MTERELQYSIEILTAMEDFAAKLKDKLQNHFSVKDHTLESEDKEKHVVKDTMPVLPPMEEENVETEDAPKTVEEVIEEFKLNSMEVDELREFLDSYEIEYSAKAKKPGLVKLIAQGILDGTIEVGDEEEDSATEEVEPEEVELAPENSAEVDESVRTEKEVEVEESVRQKITSDKLKISAVKKFLKSYYDGDPEMSDLDSLDESDLVDYYVYIQICLVDDDGEVHGMERTYYREGKIFCCGQETVEMEDSEDVYCERCGNQYGDELE
jgi:hypothetical protein